MFTEMENYAIENKVPIMELVGIEALLQLLRIQNAKKILEVGTAIGYSALRMAEALPNASIVTIERDLERIQVAEEFIVRSKHGGQIHLIKGDALEVENLSVNKHRTMPFLLMLQKVNIKNSLRSIRSTFVMMESS